MQKIWDLAQACPQAALDWLSIQVTRNRYVCTWLLSTMENWVEPYMMGHANQKVRSSAAFLLVSLVPCTHFRQTFRTTRNLHSPMKESMLSPDDLEPLHQILDFLFSLLPNAKAYTDLHSHGPGKLVAYFQAITHCLVGREQKLRFAPHFKNLWSLFHPKLSEPPISIHHNKQALLNMWYALCVDCPENIQLIFADAQIVKNIAFNYILADHEDSDVVSFNRAMLPAYYGILRMCCIQSKYFIRQLAQHQNIHWAFKNITPYTTQYTLACDELFKLMALFVQKTSDMTQEDEAEIKSFKQQTLHLYLNTLDGRASWNTLIQVLKICAQTTEDKAYVVCNNGLGLVYDSFNMLHMMFHEATACHVTSELLELLNLYLGLLKASRQSRSSPEFAQILNRWKDMGDMTGKLLTLCNTYTSHEVREIVFLCVKEMILVWPQDMLNILVPFLHRHHSGNPAAEMYAEGIGLGPFAPRVQSLNLSGLNLKQVRPPKPVMQMTVPPNTIEVGHGQNPDFDRALNKYFTPYHSIVDLMVRMAVNEDSLNKHLVDLSAMVGLDGVAMHLQLFPKLWMDIENTPAVDRKFIQMLLQSHGFIEYVDVVLLDERASLNNSHIYNFIQNFFPKVCQIK